MQHVDLKESTLTGYLNIKGLTSDCKELTVSGKEEKECVNTFPPPQPEYSFNVDFL